MGQPERDPVARVLCERRGAPLEQPPVCAPPPRPSALERLRAFTNDLVGFDDGGKPDELAKAHGFALVEGTAAGGRRHAPVYFLHDGDGEGLPTVHALVVTYRGRKPGTFRRGVLFTFDSEAN